MGQAAARGRGDRDRQGHARAGADVTEGLLGAGAHLGIPRAVLAARLQTLTSEGILEKRRYQQSPPRDEYVVTERGAALWPTLRSLGLWGREHFGDVKLRTFRHAGCGTELGPYGECPSCGTVVPVGDVLMEPGPGVDPNPTDPVSRALLRPKRLLEPIEQEQEQRHVREREQKPEPNPA